MIEGAARLRIIDVTFLTERNVLHPGEAPRSEQPVSRAQVGRNADASPGGIVRGICVLERACSGPRGLREEGPARGSVKLIDGRVLGRRRSRPRPGRRRLRPMRWSISVPFSAVPETSSEISVSQLWLKDV